MISLWSVNERSMEGEDIPKPWAVLSSHVPDVHLWQVDGGWTALGVSPWDKGTALPTGRPDNGDRPALTALAALAD